MLTINPEIIAEIIIRARELEVKVSPWGTKTDRADADSILEERSDDATEQELREFIVSLNEDEKAAIVATLWVGRGVYDQESFSEALADALEGALVPIDDYLLGEPLLAEYLEEGLTCLGISAEDVLSEILRR